MGGKTCNRVRVRVFQPRFVAMLQKTLLVVVVVALFTELKMELTFA